MIAPLKGDSKAKFKLRFQGLQKLYCYQGSWLFFYFYLEIYRHCSRDYFCIHLHRLTSWKLAAYILLSLSCL